MRDYILTTIRREGPISTSVLKSDLRTMASNGVEVGAVTDHAVLLVLSELLSEGLIRRDGDEWEAVRQKPRPAAVKQKTMF
jgi:hypothetical protein